MAAESAAAAPELPFATAGSSGSSGGGGGSSSYASKTDAKSKAGKKMNQSEKKSELGFRQYMLAGSFAGVVEHTAMFPVDTVKTRVQMLWSPCSACGPVQSLSTAVRLILQHEGAAGFYRGLGAMVLGAGPSHAAYFSCYEFCNHRFGGDREGHHPVANMLAGSCATVASDTVLTPMDVVKQRLQLKSSPYRGVWDCVSRIYSAEGIRGFYASYRTTVLMNIPFTGVHFATYEAAKKILGELYAQQIGEEHLVTHLVAGGTAGALASGITTPFDVVKTRLQCQGVCGATIYKTNSVTQVVKDIVKREGSSALFKGLKPRVLFHTPAAAISWSTYEAGKAFLHKWNAQQAEKQHHGEEA